MFARIKEFDQRIIDFLTMICWWTEVRWDKDNLYWAYVIRLFENFFAVTFFVLNYYFIIVYQHNKEYENFIFFQKYGLLFFLSHHFFYLIKLTLFESSFFDYLKENFPQGFPNPCRIEELCVRFRIKAFFVFGFVFIIVPIFCFLILKSFIGIKITEVIFFGVLVFLGQSFGVLFYFLVACDSIPPEEKQKRREKIEMWSGRLQSVHVSDN